MCAYPENGSTSLKSDAASEDLPEPVRPTIPTCVESRRKRAHRIDWKRTESEYGNDATLSSPLISKEMFLSTAVSSRFSSP